MGWKGYESTISLGMLFKQMYCKKCGNKLNRKKISQIYKKGDPNYSNYVLGQATIGMDRIEKAYYVYCCQNCGLEITYAEQCVIAKKQRLLKKKILDENN